MADDCSRLRTLNEDTFAAEQGGATQIGGQDWHEFLNCVLADDFHIVRSAVGQPHQQQTKDEMLSWIGTHERGPVTMHDQNVVSWCDETLGVVTSRITINGNDYQNIKAFKKARQGAWQCIYWQVTQLTPHPVNVASLPAGRNNPVR